MQLLNVEVCLSPALFPFIHKIDNQIVVVVDVFRATTSMIAAFDNGVKEIIPVASVDEARAFNQKGFKVAGERDGSKLDFANFGNSPPEFETKDINGKTLVFTTTNGTSALKLAAEDHTVFIAAFSNLKALSKHLIHQKANVIILCAGWKNQFSLEDTLCAGALTDLLLKSGRFRLAGDAARAAIKLWHTSANNLAEVLGNAEHANRLRNLGQEKDIAICLQLDTSSAIPVFQNDILIDLKNHEL
jgi:2-phosphosulfolactate phosphatase